MSAVYTGVDIAKDTFVAAVWEEGAGRLLGEFANRPNGFDGLAEVLEQAQRATGAERIHLALEPTGGDELALASFALERGWSVSMPNPKQLRDWAKGLGQRAKTDAQDALLLARYAAERRPPLWAPLPAEVSELESLLERKRELEAMLRQEKNRAQTLGSRPGVAPSVAPNIEAVIEALEAALQQIQQAIKRHVKASASLREPAKRLQQVPGVGAKNVLPLLVLLYRWSGLTRGAGDTKGLVAFVGLDPATYRSGTSVRGAERISRMGDRYTRAQLYMGALGGVRGHNELRVFYHRLLKRGKLKKVALVAAARKLLTWSWGVFRDQTDFQPQRAAARTI